MGVCRRVGQRVEPGDKAPPARPCQQRGELLHPVQDGPGRDVGGGEAALRANDFPATDLVLEMVTTPREVTYFFEGIINRTLDPALTADDCALMLDLLGDRAISPYLSPNLPDTATFAHKTGNLVGVLNDAGVLTLADGRTIYVAVLPRATIRPVWRSCATS
ncbi:MAG: hypothetical protein AVDCRST_MAG18-3491 [uncultured Thermomicrobiales bacterium]|uniref:beta-lactamase n=1 Tax=uncultured Thermomicrobiales bacterium TaxID=1645740 RepID=A0A6J4VRM5_9BACT|nr:MAG: hypothetical protein AVDCRST_MAG18-3491 [uncultured Thermomicrobiales bacterium]